MRFCPGSLECSESSSFALEMKSTKFATGSDEAKIAALGDALAEPDAEEQDVGGDDGEGGAGAGEDAANEKEEEEEEAPFDEKI